MKRIQTYSALFFLLLIGTAHAQLKYNDADTNFDNLLYVRAAKQYESLANKGDDSQHVLQRLGDSYFFNTDMENAVKWYGLLFSKYENVLEPEYAFRYVHALKGVGNYQTGQSHHEDLYQKIGYFRIYSRTTKR